MKKSGLNAQSQQKINVFYDEELVGDYFADIVVNDQVIVELKTADSLSEQHANQLINYLKATNIEIGLLLNFGEKPEIKRKIYSNNRKK